MGGIKSTQCIHNNKMTPAKSGDLIWLPLAGAFSHDCISSLPLISERFMCEHTCSSIHSLAGQTYQASRAVCSGFHSYD